MTDRLDPARLDELWDFTDPDASAERFASEIPQSLSDEGIEGIATAELKTQLARALGLAGRGEEADELLESIEQNAPVVSIRLSLERGRRLNSDGFPEQAVAYFADALALAEEEGEDFLTADAIHMLAIADAENSVGWAVRGIQFVDASPDARTKRWAIALHNNLGWQLFDADRFDEALTEFELSLIAAQQHGSAQQQQWAREAIDETIAALTESG